MMKTNNIPKLRFPEFINNEEIKNYSFNDLFSFSTGKNIKQNEASPEFDIPCVRYGELYHMYNEVIKNVVNSTNLPSSDLVFSEGNEILLPSAGEDPLDIGSASALTLPNVAIGRTINILRPLKKDVYSQLFASYYINHRLRKKISSLAKGVSISNVYNSDLKTLEILLPSLPEQQKIASFLTTVDDKISNLKQKISLLEKYKKGVMQQIFSQQIRFKDENGNDYPEWEEKSLGDCLEYEQPTNYLVSSTEYSDTYKTPVLTAGKTFILGYTDEEFGVFNQFPVIIFDDFTTATQFVNFSFKAKSSAMKILKSKAKNDVKFLYELMQMINYEIGGHGRHWISVYSLLDVLVPCFEEQTKIAEFLSGIDDKIETTKLQLSKMEVWKKGLLQGMFC